MKKEVKDIGILLLVIFILWNFIIICFTFGGCPPAYIVEKLHYDPNIPSNEPIAGVHITDQDLVRHPYLREAFDNEKRILIMLPIGAITDFIPGNFFGSEYTVNRMQLWEKKYFEDTIFIQQNTIWEYDGMYIKFYKIAC